MIDLVEAGVGPSLAREALALRAAINERGPGAAAPSALDTQLALVSLRARQHEPAALHAAARTSWGSHDATILAPSGRQIEASTGKSLIRPSAMISTASAARIRPISRVITLMPVRPSSRDAARRRERDEGRQSDDDHAVAHQHAQLPPVARLVGIDHHRRDGGGPGQQRNGQRHTAMLSPESARSRPR